MPYFVGVIVTYCWLVVGAKFCCCRSHSHSLSCFSCSCTAFALILARAVSCYHSLQHFCLVPLSFSSCSRLDSLRVGDRDGCWYCCCCHCVSIPFRHLIRLSSTLGVPRPSRCRRDCLLAVGLRGHLLAYLNQFAMLPMVLWTCHQLRCQLTNRYTSIRTCFTTECCPA